MKKSLFLVFTTLFLLFGLNSQSVHAENQPDLVIKNVEYISDYWRPDFQSFIINICNEGSARVDQGGTGDDQGRVKIGYNVNGTDQWGVDTPRLEEVNLTSNQCVNYITSNNIYLAKGKSYNLQISIDKYIYLDSPGNIAESNENNNSYSFSIYIPNENELVRSRGYNLHLDSEEVGKCYFRFVRSKSSQALDYKTLTECIEDNNLSYPTDRYAFEDYNCEDRLERTPSGYEDLACPEGEDIPLISKPDLDKSDWELSVFKSYIENLLNQGIVKGDSQGNYNPDNFITRAQFSTILFKSFDFNENLTGYNFPDVSSDSPHKDHILTLKNLEIIKGKKDGNFDHDGNITRGEATSLIIRAMEEKGMDLTPTLSYTFPDISDSVHEDNILNLANLNTYELERIIKGYPSGNFGPDDNITRGQAAKIFDISRTVYKNAG